MSTGTQTAKAQTLLASNVRIRNVLIVDANDENEFPLIDGLKQLRIRARNRFAVLDYYFNSGDTETVQIPNSCREEIQDLNFIGKNLYLKSDVASVTVEIVEFY